MLNTDKDKTIIKIESSCRSVIGNYREKNEDNFFFGGVYLDAENEGLDSNISKSFDTEEDCGTLLAVFDGMGGAQYGELAAYKAAKITDEFLSDSDNTEGKEVDVMLAALCKSINEEVYITGEEMGASLMGTTMAALYFCGDRLRSCNVGDSRCYRLRKGVLELLSEDHVEELYYIDLVNKNRKPGLIQFLGMDPEEIMIEPTINCSEVKTGDTYLVCSDGLTDMVTESDITAILSEASDSDDAVNKLIEMALANGGKDNITVIVCHC